MKICPVPNRGAQYSLSSALSRHKAKNHPELLKTIKKICSFEKCEKSFKRLSQLVDHFRDDHNVPIQVDELIFPSYAGRFLI